MKTISKIGISLATLHAVMTIVLFIMQRDHLYEELYPMAISFAVAVTVFFASAIIYLLADIRKAVTK
jgi:hypothetical protein